MSFFSETEVTKESCHSREFLLQLISAELINTRFFTILAQAGLKDCIYRTDLSILVFMSLGIHDIPEGLLDFYFRQIDAMCMLIDPEKRYLRIEAEIVAERLEEEIRKYGRRNPK